MITVKNKNSNMKQKLISAREIIERYHISYQTVNHYTDVGLLHVVAKDRNVRMYDEANVKKRLVEISQLINEGYPLRLIRKRLDGR